MKWLVVLTLGLLVALGPSARAHAEAAALPRVRVLATGGTIAGAQAGSSSYGYKAGAYDVNALLAAVPNLDRLARISGEQMASIGSQDMNDEVWLKLAKRRERDCSPSRRTSTGVVITHGTDTLEETSLLPGSRREERQARRR